MLWQQLTIRVSADCVPAVEALLDAAGADAVSLEDAADVPVLEPEPGEAPLWPEVVIKALFSEDVDLRGFRTLLAEILGAQAVIAVESPLDSSWEMAGREQIAPRRFGSRLWLAGADDAAPATGESCVRLHMGFAFGTGAHPTTALCLEWIDAELAPATRVLDFGCGSCVLALASLRLGASAAWATDNDPQARLAAERNAALNDVAGQLWIGTPDALPEVTVDVVLANILARPLIERAPYFAARVHTGGHVVLSGILKAQGTAVMDAYEPYFEAFSIAERDGWLRIAARRRPGQQA